MAAFDDSTDPELGAACNRLAAFVEPMAAGMVIDPASMLTEDDLALILRHLHATRFGGVAASAPHNAELATSYTSVPRTSKN